MRTSVIAAIAFVLLGLPGSFALADSIFINEFHYDDVGTDDNEFVEVAMPVGTSLSGLSIVLYNGNGGLVYGSQALANFTAGSIVGDFQLFTYNFTPPPPTDPDIQNGAPDGIALVNGSTVLEFISYEGAFTAVDGPAASMTSVDVGFVEESTTPFGSSIGLTGIGSRKSDFTYAQFTATATPGDINGGQTFTPLPLPIAACGGLALLGSIAAHRQRRRTDFFL